MPRRTDTADRAELMFALYVELGASRSLDLLRRRLAEVGIVISDTTLGTYSADFHWQDRLVAIEAKARDANDERLVQSIADMNRDQALIGRGLQTWAGSQLGILQRSGYVAKTGQEVAATAKVGVEIERLAMGEATSRSEVINDTLTAIVKDIIALFLAVNQLTDRDDRTREFGTGADAIIGRHVPALEGEVKE